MQTLYEIAQIIYGIAEIMIRLLIYASMPSLVVGSFMFVIVLMALPYIASKH